MKEIIRLTPYERRRLAEQLLGSAVDDDGYGTCPGQASHSTRNGRKDFVIYFDKKVSCKCVHASCQGECDAFIEQFRAAIWQAERQLTYGDETDADYQRRQAALAEKRKYEMPAPPTAPPAPKYVPAAAKIDGLPFMKVDAAFLRTRSPIWAETASAFLNALYRPNEKVLVFTNFYSQGDYLHWNGHGSYQLSPDPGVHAVAVEALPTHAHKGIWFLSNPVTGEWQPKKQVNPENAIEMTRRSEQNVSRWPYMVLESDEIDAKEWLSRLVQMPVPIVAIYTSGRRSLHCLVRINAPSKGEYDLVIAKVGAAFSHFGADHKALSAVRLTRLPFCQHRNFKPTHRQKGVQRLLYLNPQATDEPIYQQPPMLNL